MIRWAFAQQDVDFVEAETDPDNRASQRILEKCGFVPNGKTGEEGPPFCGGTTPNNLSVNSEKVLAGEAAIRQINLPAGKKAICLHRSVALQKEGKKSII